MKYKLTNSQRNFSVANSEYYSTLWNHGGIVFFNKVYTFDELNTAFNNLIKNFESLRMCFKNDKMDYSLFLKKNELKKYPFFCFEAEDEIVEASYKLTNSLLNSDDELITCIIFNTPTESGYIFCVHHIIIDGFSTQVMGEYLNNCLKNNQYIPKNMQSYEEYILNEETYLNSKRYQKDKKFWSQQFFDSPQCSIFEEKKTSFDYTSDEVDLCICPELFSKIKALCYNNNISVQSFFNAVYSTYVFRSLGIDFFTVGVPVLNRTTEAELNTIGLYMHIVPLLINISDGSFLENALNIEDSQMTLFRHQKFTQHDIKELLKEEGKPQNSLFDIAADYQEFEENEDYKFEFIYSNSLSLPMEIHMQSFGKEKHNLKIRYRTTMFSEKEIKTMINAIVAMCEDAVENPDKKITELNMLPSSEKELLDSFNATDYTYDVPDNSTLYSLFEKTAKQNSDKVCIKAGNKAITFGDLLGTAEKLDAEIRKTTNGKKSVIAVIAERSIEMYAAIYGIIRGGNAYLPIDPDYPQERIEYILENSNCAAVVVQGKFKGNAGEHPCIDMTEFLSSDTTYGSIPEAATSKNDTAYVIYTSGSTGAPKGAKVSHKSAVNRILWMHDKYRLESADVILQKTPYTFDVSVWELFWWGMCGGSLVASEPGEHFLPAKILEEVENNKVTHLHFVPSVFELFLNYLETHSKECDKFSSVKYVFLSGEALSASLVNRFYKLFSCDKVTLHNLYGPTECAVDVTYYDCGTVEADPVPIGKPVYNTQIYIVDRYMNLQPTGVEGELCIAGVNVGQGYLNNENLTSEKFIDNPFGSGKLYKTGDLAYWRDDGNIIFCGRIDNQIKLNGQRIEIGEIEAVIGSVEGVESAAVIVSKSEGGEMLVAFYSGESGLAAKIKAYCSDKLPGYMVPLVFEYLESMPLNPNGKLDRKLLSRKKIELFPDNLYEPPENDSERYICDIFKQILGRDNIGRNSDFFSCGGTSLSLISLLSEDGFENITAAELMRNSTPAKLAVIMEEKHKNAPEYIEALFVPDNVDKALVLLPFAGGGAEAYSNFVSAFRQQSTDTAVYFIRYLHSFGECEKAAEEIMNFLGNKELYVYSHCVGSAVALRIIENLEKEDFPIKQYFIGASIPFTTPANKNIWRFVPDNIIKYILTKAGGQFFELSDEALKEKLIQFRKDTDFSVASFAYSNEKLKTTVSLIISKSDIFTKKYKNAEKLWNNYFNTVKSIHFIDSDSHYFQSDNCQTLSEILLTEIR